MARRRTATTDGPSTAPAERSRVRSLIARIGPHLWQTAWASLFMYAGRGMGLLWGLFLVHQFGVGDYGRYAIGLAIAAVIGLTIDSYFSIRVPRVTDDVFVGERTTRLLVAAVLVGLGIVLWPVEFLAGLAFVKAGTDIAFNAVRSHQIRNGDPELAQRAEASRQITGVVIGVLAALVIADLSLDWAAAVYLIGCSASVLWNARSLTLGRPRLPVFDGSTGFILTEAVGGVLYVQIDVILIGGLASNEAAGYYSFASLVLWSLAALGQNYGFTFHRTLRASGGASEAGPRFATSVGLALITAAFMATVGLGLLILDFHPSVWITFLIMGPVSFTRTLSSTSSTILVIRHEDRLRARVTMLSLLVKGVGLLLFAQFGAPEAALVFLVSDIVMSGLYTRRAFGLGRASEASA